MRCGTWDGALGPEQPWHRGNRVGGRAVGCLPPVAACLSPQPGTPVQTCLKRRGPFGAGVQAQDPALPDGRSIGWKNLKLGEKARDEVGHKFRRVLRMP